MKNIRWVLAHEPIELFVRAAQVFADEVNSKAPDEINIEVLTLSEYSNKYNNGVAVTKHDLVQLLDQGNIEMSQTYTITLGKVNKDFFALDLPFLFSDHAHASRVFEGPIGKQLLDSLEQSVGVKGLAFTYSGGFRILPGNKQISTIEDLKGVSVRTSHSPVAIDTFLAMGATVFPMELEELTDKLQDSSIEIGESTYPRVYALGQDKVSKFVNHTEHSLFLTSILISTKFWNELTPELQTIISDAAVNAARHERDLSIEDVKLTREKCVADGITLVDLSEEERNKFKQNTQAVYEKYKMFFTEDLIENIQNN